jgi:hypothetical protein
MQAMPYRKELGLLRSCCIEQRPRWTRDDCVCIHAIYEIVKFLFRVFLDDIGAFFGIPIPNLKRTRKTLAAPTMAVRSVEPTGQADIQLTQIPMPPPTLPDTTAASRCWKLIDQRGAALRDVSNKPVWHVSERGYTGLEAGFRVFLQLENGSSCGRG